MFEYTVKFFESSTELVKTGQCMPFETYQTGSYKTARKDAIAFTIEDCHCSAVVVNNLTGNRLYFQDGAEQ